MPDNFLKFGSNILLLLIRKISHFVQPGQFHVYFQFGAVGNFALPLLVRTSLIDRFFSCSFPTKHRIFPFCPLLITFILEYMPVSGPQAKLCTNPDIAANEIDQPYNENGRRCSMLKIVVQLCQVHTCVFQSQTSEPEALTCHCLLTSCSF